MQLLGSVASPFVRRLRLVLAGQPYQFVALNIFESEGRSAVSYTHLTLPTKRIV